METGCLMKAQNGTNNTSLSLSLSLSFSLIHALTEKHEKELMTRIKQERVSKTCWRENIENNRRKRGNEEEFKTIEQKMQKN